MLIICFPWWFLYITAFCRFIYRSHCKYRFQSFMLSIRLGSIWHSYILISSQIHEVKLKRKHISVLINHNIQKREKRKIQKKDRLETTVFLLVHNRSGINWCWNFVQQSFSWSMSLYMSCDYFMLSSFYGIINLCFNKINIIVVLLLSGFGETKLRLVSWWFHWY